MLAEEIADRKAKDKANEARIISDLILTAGLTQEQAQRVFNAIFTKCIHNVSIN